MTITDNQTLLLVDGQSGRREDVEVSIDLLSQSSTFIGGLPGEGTHIYTHILLDVIYTEYKCIILFFTVCRKSVSSDVK